MCSYIWYSVICFFLTSGFLHLFGRSVIFSVIQFSIYSVLLIQSNGPARYLKLNLLVSPSPQQPCPKWGQGLCRCQWWRRRRRSHRLQRWVEQVANRPTGNRCTRNRCPSRWCSPGSSSHLKCKQWVITCVLTTHKLAYLRCQCDASLEMKLALGSLVARNERWRYP